MKQIIKKVLIIVIYIGLVWINTKVYAATGRTTNETTRLRKEPSTDSDTISLISQNTDIEIIAEEGEWYQVSYSGYTGYIRKDMLSVEGSVTNSEEQQNESEASENTNQTEPEQNTEEQQNTETEQNTITENSNELSIGYAGKLKASLELKILPSINSSVIVTITENTDFTVTDIINKWCYIETESNSGWALLSRVQRQSDTETTTNQEDSEPEQSNENTETEETSATPTEESSTKTQYVSTETLNVRESTDNNARIVAQIELNTQVTVEEVVDSTWSRITVNGITGYVASRYLFDTQITNSSRSEDLTREGSKTEKNGTNSDEKEDSEQVADTSNSNQTTTSSGTTAAEVASYAKQYLGYKYVSGGTSPSTGFDCSGFTYYVYKHFGITLGRTSTAQASNGTSVSKTNLQAGDLVIFNNSSNSAIGHVGIYMGGNTFIHAANSTKGVITTSLSDSYYKARFVSARRIIN